MTHVSGNGADTLFFASNDTVSINTRGGNDVVGAYSVTNAVIRTGDGADNVALSGRDNALYTGDGDDIILFAGSHSTIHAGAGNDRITTQTTDPYWPWSYDVEAMRVFAGDGDDIIDAVGPDGVYSGGAGDDFINVVGNRSSVDGGSGFNTIYVSGADSVITGGSGGNHVTFIGDRTEARTGAGNDTVFYSNSDAVRIDTRAGNDSITAIFVTGNTILAGAGDDTVTPSGQGNIVFGGFGTDMLTVTAGTGNGLVGDRGRDVMTDASAPGSVTTFVFESILDSRSGLAGADVIAGFTAGEDRIDLAGIAAEAGLSALAFAGGPAFSGVKGEVALRKVNGGADTRVLIDIDGDGQVDSSIILAGVSVGALSASDVILG